MRDWQEQKIKFYKFFFKGKPKPVIMEAYNRESADQMLEQLNEKTGVINMGDLEDIRIEMPIMGVSKRKRLGKTYVWVGLEKSGDGWMLEADFKKHQ